MLFGESENQPQDVLGTLRLGAEALNFFIFLSQGAGPTTSEEAKVEYEIKVVVNESLLGGIQDVFCWKRIALEGMITVFEVAQHLINKLCRFFDVQGVVAYHGILPLCAQISVEDRKQGNPRGSRIETAYVVRQHCNLSAGI